MDVNTYHYTVDSRVVACPAVERATLCISACRLFTHTRYNMYVCTFAMQCSRPWVVQGINLVVQGIQHVTTLLLNQFCRMAVMDDFGTQLHVT